jgi:hypothetical protein
MQILLREGDLDIVLREQLRQMCASRRTSR